MGAGGGGRIVRTSWSGAISFGLVNVPIKLAGATKDRDIHFHMLHDKDHARIKFKRICPEDGKEVPNEHIVRGYELAPSQYVTFTDEELQAAAPEASRTIDIQDFVALDEIDPTYYNKSYYVLPDKNAAKAYHLLLEALKATGKVGIARMVMREKEYLVALRPKDDILVLETMHFSDEVVPSASVAAEAGKEGSVDKRQLELAQKLIESLSAPFEPERYASEYRERVLELIDQKAAGKEIVVEPEAKPVVKTTDLLAALERSLAGLRKSTPGVAAKPKAARDAEAGDQDDGHDAEDPAAHVAKPAAKARPKRKREPTEVQDAKGTAGHAAKPQAARAKSASVHHPAAAHAAKGHRKAA